MTQPVATPEIITGDAVNLIQELEDKSINLVVTSPPYPGQKGNRMGVQEWLRWTKGWLSSLKPKMAPNSVIVLNVMIRRVEDTGWFDHRLYRLADPRFTGYKLLDVYKYGKLNPPPAGPLTYCDPPGWEPVFILTNARRPTDVAFYPVRAPYARSSINGEGLLYTNMSDRRVKPHPEGARQSTLMMMSMSGDQNRPHAKGISFPRDLPRRFIMQYTDPGAFVLDPFCGVGTTLMAAFELGRRAIGFELNAAEAERAREWLSRAQRPLFVE